MKAIRNTWLILGILFGALFIIWGAITQNRPLIRGDVWLVMPGVLFFFMGILGFLEDLILSNKILKYLTSKKANNKTLTELSSELNIHIDELREFIFSLRAQGRLKISFNTTNGTLMTLDSKAKISYCKRCGHLNVINEFCPVCGEMNVNEISKKAEKEKQK